MFKFSKIVSAVALAVAGVAANADVVIDTFDTDQASYDATAAMLNIKGVYDITPDSKGAANETSGAGIIGGFRDVYISSDSGNSLNQAQVSGGNFSLSSASQNVAQAIVRWDGDNSLAGGSSLDGLSFATAQNTINATGLLASNGGIGYDLAGFASGIAVKADSDTLLTIEFRVYTDANNWSSQSFTYTSGFVGNTMFLFDNFVNQGSNGGANFSNVGAMSLLVNVGGTLKSDIEIDFVKAVPEPGSLALAGLALAGLGMARRRKAAAK